MKLFNLFLIIETLLTINPCRAEAQDSTKFFLIIKAVYEHKTLSKDLFFENADSEKVAYLLLNESFLKAPNFNELSRKTANPVTTTYRYLQTIYGDVFLIVKMTMFSNTEITKFAIIEKLKLKRNKAVVNLYTSGNYYVGSPDRLYEQYNLKLVRTSSEWKIKKIKKGVRKCCYKY